MDEQNEPIQSPQTNPAEQPKPETEKLPILPGQHEALELPVPATPQSVIPPVAPNPTPHTVTSNPVASPKEKPSVDQAKKARAAIQTKKRQKLDKILAEVAAKGSISNNEVEALLGVSDATASRYLVALQKEGSLKRIGNTGKAVRYEPAKNGDLG